MRIPAHLTAVGLLLATTSPAQSDPDRDGDGLPDFQEVHKYGTDPDSSDSDGDGTPDGDWQERREFAYTVRSILHVMRPVTPDVFQDDYQDARILDEGDDWVELEVVHYPLNTVASALAADPDWRETTAGMTEWTAPGPTANWDDAMRDELVAALAADGIDAGTLDDRSLVERAVGWLLRRAEPHSGFTTFNSSLQDGAMRIHPGIEARAERGVAETGRSVAEQQQRELFAKGMFERRTRGTCTSTAIYLNGCLRALGIPTRIVLCTPVVDASDADELAFLDRLENHRVRATITTGIGPRSDSWTSHTFNEVFVGGRWRRLNQQRLGANILDRSCFGLMTHVATFSDWADGNMAATWGLRQATRPKDLFAHANPYSAITLSDRFGEHCGLANPPVLTMPNPVGAVAQVPALETLTIRAVVWSDAEDSPVTGLTVPGGPALLLHVGPSDRFDDYKRFTAATDLGFTLEADGHPPVRARAPVGGVTQRGESYIPLRPEGGTWDHIAPGAAYRLVPTNGVAEYPWDLAEPFEIRR